MCVTAILTETERKRQEQFVPPRLKNGILGPWKMRGFAVPDPGQIRRLRDHRTLGSGRKRCDQ